MSYDRDEKSTSVRNECMGNIYYWILNFHFCVPTWCELYVVAKEFDCCRLFVHFSAIISLPKAVFPSTVRHPSLSPSSPLSSPVPPSPPPPFETTPRSSTQPYWTRDSFDSLVPRWQPTIFQITLPRPYCKLLLAHRPRSKTPRRRSPCEFRRRSPWGCRCGRWGRRGWRPLGGLVLWLAGRGRRCRELVAIGGLVRMTWLACLGDSRGD